MWGGFFMVVPLIAVHYVGGLGWAAASVGLVLALRQFTQQGLAFVGGILADRFGVKPLICTGLLVRTLGFAGMAWADTLPLLIATTVLAALGGALFEAPKAAAIAALTKPEERSRFYSLLGVVSGLGVTVGTFVGALLLKTDFAVVALAAGGLYALTFLLTLALLPPLAAPAPASGLGHGTRLALRDRPFVLFNVLLMGYWFMWVQLSIALPLVATRLSGTSEAVGWIYAINAGMSVVLQYPLLRLAERRLAPLAVLKLGMGLMALGLALVALAGTVPQLLACVALFSLGGLLAAPSQQTVTANLAHPAALGSYFGVAGFGLAVGGGLGNFLGGLFYGLGETLALPALPWLLFAAVGAASLAGLALLFRPPAPRPASLSALEAQTTGD